MTEQLSGVSASGEQQQQQPSSTMSSDHSDVNVCPFNVNVCQTNCDIECVNIINLNKNSSHTETPTTQTGDSISSLSVNDLDVENNENPLNELAEFCKKTCEKLILFPVNVNRISNKFSEICDILNKNYSEIFFSYLK